MKRVMLSVLVFAVLSIAAGAQSFDTAKEAFVNATLDLEQLKAEGLPYASIEDHLFVMNESLVGRDEKEVLALALLLNKSDAGKAKAFEYFRMVEEAKKKGLRPGQNFGLVVREGRIVRGIRDDAFAARDLVAGLRSEVESSAAANDSRTKELLNQMDVAFKAERYSELGELVNATRARVEDVEVERARERAFLGVERHNLASYAWEHAWQIVLVVVVLSLAGVWLGLELRFSRAVRVLSWTKSAMKGAEEGLLGAQRKYYAGELGRATYQQRVAQYQEKLRDLKAKLGVAQSDVERFRKFSVLGRLRRLR